MNAGEVYGRGFAFPPRVGSEGSIALSEGEENVRESIRVILMTEPQERVRRPTFGGGLGRFLFEPNNATTRHAIQERITQAIAAWERRVLVESVSVDPDPADAESVIATIEYKLVATQSRERLSVSVTLSD